VTSVSLSDQDPASLAVDTLVVGVASTKDRRPVLVGASALPDAIRGSLSAALEALGVTGAIDEVLRVPAGPQVAATTVTLTGLGKVAPTDGPEPEALRRAAGAASRAVAGLVSAAFLLPADDVRSVAAVAEGALFGAYSFTRHRHASAAQQKAPLQAVTVVTPMARDASAGAATVRAGELAAGLTLARDLVNTAPGDLPPMAFADAVLAAAATDPVTVTVLDDKALARGGYGGILGVGQGSSRPPCLVKISYEPTDARRHLAIIGKGITFDTGGISLKPPAGMETMKSDMAGGAAVVGAVLALARLGTPVRITAWVPLAENMPSGTAQRPSDVLTMYGGRTVEVLNTDAEGRLVLADALVAASAEHPDAIVDIATLTGHQVLALGHRYAAVMGDEDLRGQVARAAGRVGETVWPMPLPVELRASLDSPVADLANIGERMGGMLVAGLFLKEFVGDRIDGSGPIPWAHLDIAGPSYNEGKPWGYTPKGGTGHGLRTLVGLAEDLVAEDPVAE
jgi:leucyl aminopeptidase